MARTRTTDGLIRAALRGALTRAQTRRLTTRLRRYKEDIFTFPNYACVPADNHFAERLTRPAVILRKNSQSNRSDHGPATQAALMSVYRTLRLRGLSTTSGDDQFVFLAGLPHGAVRASAVGVKLRSCGGRLHRKPLQMMPRHPLRRSHRHLLGLAFVVSRNVPASITAASGLSLRLSGVLRPLPGIT